ncbi:MULTISPECIES: hypothetical protein [Streptacidiphilus]|uniref:Uncharacterized protein n=1 Tax=Streptacidiphilus cavernicola TaxID=3342716 RepID=A0ABV6UTA9_9ACTN|nr:hypothetical protein [Streptacidiphilus jeojiense]
MKGSTYRRCYCRDIRAGNPFGKACLKPASRKHGSHSIREELPNRPGRSPGGHRCTSSIASDHSRRSSEAAEPHPDVHPGPDNRSSARAF